VCHQIWQFTVQCKYTCINIYCRGCTFKTFLTQLPSLQVSPAAQSHKLRYTLFRLTLSSLGYITVMLIGVLFGRHVSPSPRRSKHVAMLYGFPPRTQHSVAAHSLVFTHPSYQGGRSGSWKYATEASINTATSLKWSIAVNCLLHCVQ